MRNLLADIWTKSAMRNRVTKADDQIQRMLKTGDPSCLSSHVSEGLYRLDIFPLSVYYVCEDESFLVRIVNVVQLTSR